MGPAGAWTALACLATVVWASSETGQRQAPKYSQATIVNLASGRAGELAPNTLAAIYGEELSATVRAREPGDLLAGYLPYVLPGTGVTVKVNGLLAGVEYASPEVIVFVVPADLLPGPAVVQVTKNALNGPAVKVQLSAAAPALMPYEGDWVLAKHGSDSSWVSGERPLQAGEEVVVYATGLGATSPPQANRKVANEEAGLEVGVVVVLGGVELGTGRVSYAGVTLGMAGVYEVRFEVPKGIGADPVVRLKVAGKESQEGMRLRVEESAAQPEPAEVRSKE